VRGGQRFALRFISGKYQGGEFPLYPDREILVGRSSDLDMVLVEDMVSRKHAKISISGDQIFIQDLGSTNGSFVNGEKIRRARLKEGDRILIGTSIIKVVSVDSENTTENADEAKRRMAQVSADRRTSQARTMTGTIDEVPLPDLLQLFATSKKTGALTVRREDETGRIYLRQGKVYFASINDNQDISPLKAMYRILTWNSGSFDFGPAEEKEYVDELDEPLEMLLMEGMRQIDEIANLGPDLPDHNATLLVSQPLVPPLRELSPEELDVLQLVYNYGHMETVLNKSLAMDFETCSILLKLFRGNYVRVVR
jgi:pSer/pThr/pTyr-binding forkhead associated (FHA) protein